MSKCKKCSSDLEPGQKFCSFCGASQEKKHKKNIPPTQGGYTTQAGGYVPGQPGQLQGYQAPGQYPGSYMPQGLPPKKKSKAPIIALIIVVVLVVLGVVAVATGVLPVFGGRDKPAEPDSGSSYTAPPTSGDEPGGSVSSGSSQSPDSPGSVGDYATGAVSVVGSWSRHDIHSYGDAGYTFSQIDLLEDGTCSWYQAPGSENVVTGTYEVWRGEEARKRIQLSQEDWLYNKDVLEGEFGTEVTMEELFLVRIEYTSATENGVTEDAGMVHYYTMYIKNDGTYAIVLMGIMDYVDAWAECPDGGTFIFDRMA